MQQMEISIGSVKTKVNYNSENEKTLFENISKELNKEYNKITVNLNCNIDETILLSFLLFETGIKLNNLMDEKMEENMFLFIKSISKYIQQNKISVNTGYGEKINEIEKTKEKLIVANIIKKIELNGKNQKGAENQKNEYLLLIDNFAENIKSDIKNLENKILLY